MKNVTITQAEYEKRFNTGKYEHEEYRLTASLEKGADAVAAIEELKKVVAQAHSGDSTVAVEVEEETDEEETVAPKAKAPKASAKKAKKVTEEIEEDDEKSSDSIEESDDEEEDEIEEKKQVTKKSSKQAAPAKGKKSKIATYSRTDDLHKKLFSDYVAEVNPKWKDSSNSKAKVKMASQELEGEEFLDEDGEILASFKKQVKALVK